MKPLASQRKLVGAVQGHFRQTKRQIESMLLAASKREPSYANPEIRNIQVAQNVLRTCMEATLNEMLPYSELTAVELAIRLASYAISTLPIEGQDEAMAHVLATLPSAHSRRLAAGIIINCDWETNGLRQENVPGGRN